MEVKGCEGGGLKGRKRMDPKWKRKVKICFLCYMFMWANTVEIRRMKTHLPSYEMLLIMFIFWGLLVALDSHIYVIMTFVRLSA